MAVEVNYRLGSIAYDQDFDFVESYCRWYNGTASDDEIKSIKMGYLSALYKYKDKLSRFLDNLFTNDQLGYPYKYKSDTIYKFSYDEKITHENLSVFKENIYTILDELFEELDREFSIDTVQRVFLVISNGFCLMKPVSSNPKIMSMKNNLRDSRNYRRFCYLTNDTGLFGFNTWLYAKLNGVNLVGVPSNPITRFDFLEECPTIFMKHDYSHSIIIERFLRNTSYLASIYKQIHFDPEATLLQKELLLCALWIVSHETPGLFRDLFQEHKAETHEIDLVSEFERFRYLILTQEFIDEYYSYMKLPRKTVEQINIELDTDDNHASVIWRRYVMFYFRQYCLKYYDVSEPDKSVQEILYS